MRTDTEPGGGLVGRESPNDAVDTKFYSQDSKATQTTTGVVKVEQNSAGIKVTKQNLDGSVKVIREDQNIKRIEPKSANL